MILLREYCTHGLLTPWFLILSKHLPKCPFIRGCGNSYVKVIWMTEISNVGKRLARGVAINICTVNNVKGLWAEFNCWASCLNWAQPARPSSRAIHISFELGTWVTVIQILDLCWCLHIAWLYQTCSTCIIPQCPLTPPIAPVWHFSIQQVPGRRSQWGPNRNSTTSGELDSLR